MTEQEYNKCKLIAKTRASMKLEEYNKVMDQLDNLRQELDHLDSELEIYSGTYKQYNESEFI
jgi:hypothetical protein